MFERGGDLAVGVANRGSAGRAGAVGTRRVQRFPLILVIYITVQINCVSTNISFGQEISQHSYQTALVRTLTRRVNILHLLMY